jgi:DNA topoisomerase-1
MDGTSLIVEAKQAAKSAGLRYASDEQPGLRRKGAGKGFRYLDPGGKPVKDPRTLERIRALAVPPAWTDVWICPFAEGHIQATGRDAKGRKQYRYHADFRAVREDGKYEHMLDFAAVLPKIREAVSKDMARRDLSRECVLATVVHLLETTLIRVGNDEYAKQNKSYGLTTLRVPHVKIEGSAIRFQFLGKSGKTWRLQVKDRRIAKIVRACQDLPGQRLFQYRDEAGEVRDVTSADVNAYLKEITGREITAKDFRTWAGTVMAALALQEFEAIDSQAAQKKNIRQAIERVAARLGNTPTICRKCYVHPEVLNAYVEGNLLLEVKREAEQELREELATLKPEEAAVLAMLEARLQRTLEGSLKDSLAALKKPRAARKAGAKTPGARR